MTLQNSHPGKIKSTDEYMNTLFVKLKQRAKFKASELAIKSAQQQVSNLQLLERVECLANQLEQTKLSCVALYMDNSIEWIIADLAAMQLGITLIPIPLFFSEQQRQHLISDAGIQAVITQSQLSDKFNFSRQQALPHMQLLVLKNSPQPNVQQLQNVAKITCREWTTICVGNRCSIY